MNTNSTPLEKSPYTNNRFDTWPRGLKTIAFGVELLLCFGPITCMWAIACALFYSGFRHSFFAASPVSWWDTIPSPAYLAMIVVGGAAGLYALTKVLLFITRPKAGARASWTVVIGIVSGLICAVMFLSVPSWEAAFILGGLPILASAHVIYLGRAFIFGRFEGVLR